MGKKHQCVVASCAPPTGDLARNPGMCPDWESNLQPVGSQASTPSTEPHQPVLIDFFNHQIFINQAIIGSRPVELRSVLVI